MHRELAAAFGARRVAGELEPLRLAEPVQLAPEGCVIERARGIEILHGPAGLLLDRAPVRQHLLLLRQHLGGIVLRLPAAGHPPAEIRQQRKRHEHGDHHEQQLLAQQAAEEIGLERAHEAVAGLTASGLKVTTSVKVMRLSRVRWSRTSTVAHAGWSPRAERKTATSAGEFVCASIVSV